MIFLEAKNIVKDYAEHRALDKLNLRVEKGSIYGLLGPNGAGKTSLIRIINQITAPDSGEIIFNNEKLKPKHIQQIGYLPEERGLYKKMKVGEQALYLAQLKGMNYFDAKKKLKYWFEKFEIISWWDKKVEELSKGMQQKIQFVITILHDPKLLIFDEPFSGFDPVNANLLKEEILNLRNNGATILFSTHNMSSVEEICDNISLINKSKNILDGRISDIKNKFKKNKYEISFTNKDNIEFDFLLNQYNIERISKDKIIINPIVEKTKNQIILDFIDHIEFSSFREILPSINDIFIDMVSQTK
ncbi:MAG: ATP-binding cassette domain-containing protein [Marinifilaceae bacterium]|jgi:ABC-2 type transport system ATP-binding protein|nr:ATP-binding cassette domain-containing protein [Marinifilaceae bacterium]